MTALGNIQGGSRITAAMLQDVAPLVAYKSADQSIVSSTTFVNDSQLFVPVLANAVYIWQAYIIYEGGVVGSSDFDIKWTLPGASGSLVALQTTRSGTTGILNFSAPFTGTLSSGTGGAGVHMGISWSGVVQTTSAGTMQMAFAQNTPSATTTFCHAGSWSALWQIQ